MRMFGTSNWTELILDAVDSIGDEAGQRRTWWGPPDQQEISSPDEEINRLFSDLDFDRFLDTAGSEMTAEQHLSGERLRTAINEFCSATPEFLNPYEVIDDPRWVNIRRLANEFSQSLRGST